MLLAGFMESTCEPQMIQISKATMKQLKKSGDKWHMPHRHDIQLVNGATMSTFWLMGLKAT